MNALYNMIYLIKVFSLFAVIASCAYATFTDIKYRKISNKLTYSLISLAIIINLIYSIAGKESIIPFIRNFIATLTASFIMYYAGLWSPGDSKLFLAIAILIPIDFFKYYLIPSYPSLSILINTFVPGFFTIATYVLIKTNYNQKIESLKRTFNYKFVLNFLLIFFIFFSAGSIIVNLLFNITNIIQNFFFAIAVYLLFFYLLDYHIPERYHKYIYFIFFLTAVFNLIKIYYFEDIAILKEFIYSFLITFFSFLILRFFFLDLSKFVFVKEVKIDEIKEGDVPIDMIFKSGSGYFKREVGYFSLVSQLRKPRNSKEIIGHRPDGLSKEDIRVIKRIRINGCFNTFKIQKSIHFALFILIGILITIFSRGDFILFLLYK